MIRGAVKRTLHTTLCIVLVVALLSLVGCQSAPESNYGYNPAKKTVGNSGQRKGGNLFIDVPKTYRSTTQGKRNALKIDAVVHVPDVSSCVRAYAVPRVIDDDLLIKAAFTGDLANTALEIEEQIEGYDGKRPLYYKLFSAPAVLFSAVKNDVDASYAFSYDNVVHVDIIENREAGPDASKCTLTRDEAQTLANEKAIELNFDIYDLQYAEAYGAMEESQGFYVFKFAKKYRDVKCNTLSYATVKSIYPIFGEEMQILVDDQGIACLSATEYTQQEIVEENVALMPFQDMIELVESNVESLPIGADLTYTSIEFVYLQIPFEGERYKYIYTPVWCFSVDEIINSNAMMYFFADARTGEIIR